MPNDDLINEPPAYELPENISEEFPPPPLPPRRFPTKYIAPLIALVLFLPALIYSVSTGQSIFSMAKKPSCTVISSVRINPGLVSTWLGTDPVQMSALAFDEQGQPVPDKVVYNWGISSIESIGQLKPDQELALFTPRKPGRGDIWVRAHNPCTKDQVIVSVPVEVSSVAPSPTPVPEADKRVFITSTLYNGNLGGLSGADTKCQERADAAELGGTWKAWISDNTTPAADRLAHSDVPYTLLNGTQVAKNWTDLIDGQLASAINIDEYGVFQGHEVWTGTNQYGQINDPNVSKCSDWSALSNDSPSGPTGHSGYTDYRWTRYSLQINCADQNRLYCLEQ